MAVEGGIEEGYSGRHVLIDLYGCDSELANDHEILLSIMKTAAVIAGATVMQHLAYKVGKNYNPTGKNTPNGVSILVGLDESHVSCHTYAEAGMIAIDIFMCGKTAIPRAAVNYIFANIKCKHKEVQYINRFKKEWK